MTTTRPPLIRDLYTADPSAHVFEGRVYIYPSHDLDQDLEENALGDHFAMTDYHVFSQETPEGPVTDHGEVLHVDQVPWAARQMWAPDAACRDGRFYFYFPAKDRYGVVRIGVAIAPRPEGPFTPDPEPIPGTFSIDPCAFPDDDGDFLLYLGGLWGGQLQRWRSGSYDPTAAENPSGDGPALCPKVARLSDDMRRLATPAQDLVILDEEGEPLKASDNARRFFEGPWMHKYQETYYFSYSTGDTHFLCYATGESALGPFQYRGRFLSPPVGWTTHHSIVEFQGRWYLYYHDASLSGGVTHKRCVKVQELLYEEDGSIRPMEP